MSRSPLRRRMAALTYRLHELDVLLLLLDHGLEVDVDFDAKSLVGCLALTPHLLYIVHSFATFLPVDLQFFDLVKARRFLVESPSV